jgi:cytochrome c peroxidase
VVAFRKVALIGSLFATVAFAQQLSRPEAFRRARELSELGRKLFFDTSLSASGKISCASCHDPRFAYGPANALPVQVAGKDLKQWGIRAVPSLRYLQVVPAFTEHSFDETNGDESVDSGPTGGLAWDGRVDRGRDQARIPLLAPYEMANENPAAVVARALQAKYASAFRDLNAEQAFALILEAIEAWEQDPVEFYPYSSKYDAFLKGKATLTDQEQYGLKLFTDPSKGNCARCHIASRGVNGTPPQFTDYGLVAIGVPRNPAIPANSDANWYDLGMCGPDRTDFRGRSEYCGRFMTPTLRNVALRQTFFHNGVFHSLKDVLDFYASRDSNPEKWYPQEAAGRISIFNDLPAEYRANVDRDPPFGGARGAKPALTGEEIDDIIAFLKTLTDGFQR